MPDANELINLFRDWTPVDDDGKNVQLQEDIILLGGRDTVTRWWVSRMQDRDEYGVYLVRYHGARGSNPWMEYLLPGGKWAVTVEGEQVLPVWTLDGYTVHTLSVEGFFIDREKIDKALNRVCAEIIAEVLIRFGAVEVEEEEDANAPD